MRQLPGKDGRRRWAPSIAASASENLVVVWTAQIRPDPEDPNTWHADVYAQRFGVMPTPGITVSPTSGLVTSEDRNQATFTVVLDTEPAGDVTIDISSNDTSERTVSPTALSFNSTTWDTPQTVTVTGVDDGEVDGDVLYAISLDPSGSSDPEYAVLTPADVSVTNLDNDGSPPTCSLAIGDASKREGKGGASPTMSFTVTRSGDASQEVRVDYATADGLVDPATANVDYVPAAGTLILAPGQTTARIDVSIIGDADFEPDETLFVELSNPTGATIADDPTESLVNELALMLIE